MNCKIATVNCNGWSRKRALIENLVTSEGIQILSISEIRTKPTTQVRILNFNIHCKHGPNQFGGTALAIANHLAFAPITIPDIFSHIHACGVRLSSKVGPIHIFSVYFQPQRDLPLDFLLYVLSFPKAIIMGDFNARHHSFGDHNTNKNGRTLADFLLGHNISRIPNSSPTFLSHLGSSIIDHILISDPLMPLFADECYIGQSITSDHIPVIVSCDLFYISHPPSTTKTLWDWNLADWSKFRLLIAQNVPPAPNSLPEQIDATISALTTCIQNASAASVPSIEIDYSRPPLPRHIIRLIKDKRKIYRDFIRSRDPALKTLWNRQCAIIRRLTIEFKEASWTNTCSKLDHRNGKKFWDKFKALTGQKSSISPPLLVNGIPTQLPSDKAEAFAHNLSTICTAHRGPPFSDDRINRINQYVHSDQRLLVNPEAPAEEINCHPLLSVISDEETSQAVHSGKNTAPGSDLITRKTLRQLPPEAITLLAAIYNRCLQSGHFPTA